MQVGILESTQNPEEVVCRAARGDYSSTWVGPDQPFERVMETVEGDTTQEKKETLIEHLMRSGHWGPFEHPQATFAVKGVSRTCMAQLTRHRHASFDVMSLRYVELNDDEPLKDRFAFPDTFSSDEAVSREGLEEIDLEEEERLDMAEEIYTKSIQYYNELVESGVPKEDARMLLPLGTKVNLTFSMNARALMHLFDMRLKSDAQWEIRELTKETLEHCREWMPYTFELYGEKHPFKLSP